MKVDDSNEKHVELLIMYAKALRKKVISSIHDEKFSAIPLHLKMIAEIFQRNQNQAETWQGCEEFLDLGQNKEPEFPQELDVCDLYERFVIQKIKFVHYLGKKEFKAYKTEDQKKLNKDCQELQEKYESLALYKELDEDNLLDTLLTPQQIQDVEGLITELNGAEQNVGICEMINNRPLFVHSTFAEFLIANIVGIR